MILLLYILVSPSEVCTGGTGYKAYEALEDGQEIHLSGNANESTLIHGIGHAPGMDSFAAPKRILITQDLEK